MVAAIPTTGGYTTLVIFIPVQKFEFKCKFIGQYLTVGGRSRGGHHVFCGQIRGLFVTVKSTQLKGCFRRGLVVEPGFKNNTFSVLDLFVVEFPETVTGSEAAPCFFRDFPVDTPQESLFPAVSDRSLVIINVDERILGKQRRL